MLLMYLSSQLGELPGVLRAMAIMGTDGNKELLATTGIEASGLSDAGPNDLVVAVLAEDEPAAEQAAARLQEMMSERISQATQEESAFRSVEGAAAALPGANLALVSVPGRYAAREARKALDMGLHVFLFSDNVPLEQEIELKRIGRERGLLVMGPDCGTAIVNGVGLGFANVVRRGPIGIVGASGTGIQEVTSLLDRAGLGISHALGTGGRDLSAQLRGSTTLQALDLLDEDPDTGVIVLISKPPAPEVAELVLERASRCRKPVVSCLLGQEEHGQTAPNVHHASTLAKAVLLAAELAGGDAQPALTLNPAAFAWAAHQGAFMAPSQRYVRGLFSGGTLCEEAMLVWRKLLGDVRSNVPLRPELRLPDPLRSQGHAAIDLGDDLFTSGRPHPMIDPGTRRERLLQEAADPEVAVIVLDVVLGYGSNEDMAGELAPAISEARESAERQGRRLFVVAHVCGTEADPQGLKAQEEKLTAAGAVTCPSNTAAARLAALIIPADRREAR
jgi:FdrA protein